MTTFFDEDHRPIGTTDFQYPQEEDSLDDFYYWEDWLAYTLNLLRGNGTIEDITKNCLSFVFTIQPQALSHKHLLRGLALNCKNMTVEVSKIPPAFTERLKKIAGYLSDARYSNSFSIRCMVFLYVFRQLPDVRNQVELARRMELTKQCVSKNVFECKQFFGIRTKNNRL
jgi:hypothetical protein